MKKYFIIWLILIALTGCLDNPSIIVQENLTLNETPQVAESNESVQEEVPLQPEIPNINDTPTKVPEIKKDVKVVASSSPTVTTGGMITSEGPGSQINIRTGNMSGVKIYYDDLFQASTGPIEGDEFGYLIDKIVGIKGKTVSVGYHNIVLIKNNIILFNQTIYVSPFNSSARGEWIKINQ